MVETYISDEIQVTHEQSATLSVPAGIVVSGIWGMFKGITTAGGGPQSTSGAATQSGASIIFPDPANGAPYTSYNGSFVDRIWGPGYYVWLGTTYTLGSEQSAEFNRSASGPGTYKSYFTNTNCPHALSGSYSASWDTSYEAKTTTPWFTIKQDYDYGLYDGTLENGQWGTTSKYNGANTNLNVGGNTTFYFYIGGSLRAGFKLKVEYSFLRPTKLHEMRIKNGTKTIILPLVSNTDAALEVKGLRTYLNGTVYTIDAVDTADAEASGLRFRKNAKTYAVRKVT